MQWGIMWARCVFLLKSIKGRAGPTCRARGFQRMFFSRAGAELRVLWGRFFRVRDTTPLSALSEPTRLRNCQPTCGQGRTEGQAHTLTCWQVSIIWILNNTITALHLSSACSLNSVHVVIGSGLLSLLCKASGCGGGESIYRAFMWCNLPSIWKQMHLVIYLATFLASVFTKPCKPSLSVGHLWTKTYCIHIIKSSPELYLFLLFRPLSSLLCEKKFST